MLSRNLLAGLTVAFVGALQLHAWLQPDSPACVEAGESLQICVLSEMQKLSRVDEPQAEHPDFDLTAGPATLHSARNETVALQLLLRTTGKFPPEVEIALSAFSRDGVAVEPAPQARFYQAHYHHVGDGGYQWGPPSDVLPWPSDYPDALVPEHTGCLGEQHRLYTTYQPSQSRKQNALAWLDLYSPSDLAPGRYQADIVVRDASADREIARLPLALEVWPSTLPGTPTLEAVGELYRTYRLEGVGEDPSVPEWQRMSQCYQQLAHQHRTVFLERSPDRPDTAEDWTHYARTWGPVLDGSLFTPEYGYRGTGEGVPVSVWRTPWPQPYDVKLDGPLSEDEVDRYHDFAADWQREATARGWTAPRTFAYVFDEVDGPNDEDTGIKRSADYIAMTHEQIARVQRAIDAGSGDLDIPLIWTSHSNPARWAGEPGLDLIGTTRFWAPNAHAADPNFLQTREKAGETTWFYHSGHPAIGAHSINASGIDMRTWGVIGARYGISGQLMWAVNLGSDERPFAEPSYKPDDDRFGNGVLVYPGNQLEKIGYPAQPGPIPSIRLKNWRRGLQDADLIALARAVSPTETEALVTDMMPSALADAVATGNPAPAWPRESARWIDFKQALLRIASADAPEQ